MTSASRLIVSLSPDHNVYHSGYLISAACWYGSAFRVDPDVSPLVPVLRANGMSVAVDLFDSPKTYHLPSLETCDLYLKRSYAPQFIPEGFSPKVSPFGLNYSCRTAAALWAAFSQAAGRSLRPQNVWSFLRSPKPDDFELPPSCPADGRILFHTRVWPESQVGPDDDATSINAFRVNLVHRLRESFGARFVGGVIRSPEATSILSELDASPDLFVNTPHQRTAYAKFSRGPAVAIYTQGLHRSNAFKAAEYLASSKCVIGESLAFRLPEPLGDSHVVRDSVEDIVSECDRVLTHPKQLDELRHLSWNYYQRNIRYDRLIGRLPVMGNAWRSR
jgi:hypothetical protein